MELKKILKLKEKIKLCVNNTDPWYLIEMGAPEDEYNSHIDRITSFMINSKLDLLGIETELYKIFKTDEFVVEEKKIKKLAENIGKMLI